MTTAPTATTPLEVATLSQVTVPFGAEIVAFLPTALTGGIVPDLAYVTSGDGLQLYDVSDPSAPEFVTVFPPTVLSAIDSNDVTSVAVGEIVSQGTGAVAFAAPGANEQAPGNVVLTVGPDTWVFEVGALPDMVAFTPDGSKLLVANEGEPGYSGDPKGSVSIIDVAGAIAADSPSETPANNASLVTTVDFTAFDSQQATLEAAGLRIFPGETLSDDVEPEFIAVSPDNTTAFVTLQEANAIAVLDIATATFTEIRPLPLKDHSLAGNGLDASDRDSGINIQNWPVFGLLMPDAVATFEVGGVTYYATANEGDARDEDERIRDLTLDPTAFPDAANLQLDENIGRLEASSIDGDTDGDGDFDQLFVYGGRSFSIFDAAGNLVFDSGDLIAQITANEVPDDFNTDDTRSDAKGAEPETVEFGEIGGVPYLFIALERTDGVLMFDVSDPAAPVFADYLTTPGDLGPEGLEFVAAADSPTGEALLFVASEVSETMTTYQFTTPSFDLQITEMWPGQDGVDVTEDWFEITNFGSVAWTASIDGDLFYDDESADPNTADLVSGLTSIGAGESAIVVIGTGADATEFEGVWDDVLDLTNVEIGWADGAGLGQTGDGANIWLGHPTVSGVLLDTETYPDASGQSGASFDVIRGAFSQVGVNGAVATTQTGGTSGTEPAIASPGLIAALPTAAPLISEFQPNPTGSDPATQTVELSGEPGAAFTGSLVYIESDPGGSNPGDINDFFAVSGTFDANGLLTVSVGDPENPSFTLVLTDSFTGSDATDVDTNNDGTPDDLSTFGTIYDAIGIRDDDDATTLLYGTALGGTDFAFTGDEPRLVFRDASRDEWYAVNDPDNGEVFDEAGTDVTPGVFDTDPTAGLDTFGSINPSVIVDDGDNTLIGTPDPDTLDGKGGDDTIFGRGDDDILIGGPGADAIDGEEGFDTADYSDSAAGVDVRLWRGAAAQESGDAEGDVLSNIERVVGSAFNDGLAGANGQENTLEGLGGNDFLFGARQADTLLGGEGDDQAFGRASDDTLNGDAGDDILNGGAGADAIDGGADFDTADYSDSAAGVDVRLWRGAAAQESGDAEGDVLSNIERVVGSAFNDGLAGANGQSNTLEGLGGNDFLFGARQTDTLLGGEGDDQLFGRASDDTLDGGAGLDILNGGAGADDLDGGADLDAADYSDSSAGVDVRLWRAVQQSGDAEGDTLTGIEAVLGSAFNDGLAGANAQQNALSGQGGNDFLFGANLEDLLIGGEGDDTLLGRNGDDSLTGGTGADTMTGGLGDDNFVVFIGDGADLITDFQVGQDDIELFTAGVITDISQLTIMDVVNGVSGALVTGYGGYGDSLLLQGVVASDLTNADFAYF